MYGTRPASSVVRRFRKSLGAPSNGRLLPMETRDASLGLFAMAGPAATIIISAILLRLLPNEVRIMLAAWVLMSFPIGVLFGHCVLSEA
jgi:hypothetical protein